LFIVHRENMVESAPRYCQLHPPQFDVPHEHPVGLSLLVVVGRRGCGRATGAPAARGERDGKKHEADVRA